MILNILLLISLLLLVIFVLIIIFKKKEFKATFGWVMSSSLSIITFILLILFSKFLTIPLNIFSYLLIYFYITNIFFGVLYFTKYKEIFINTFIRKLVHCFLLILITICINYFCYLAITQTPSNILVNMISNNFFFLSFQSYFIIISIIFFIVLFISFIKYHKTISINIYLSLCSYNLSFMTFLALVEFFSMPLFTVFLILMNISYALFLIHIKLENTK